VQRELRTLVASRALKLLSAEICGCAHGCRSDRRTARSYDQVGGLGCGNARSEGERPAALSTWRHSEADYCSATPIPSAAGVKQHNRPGCKTGGLCIAPPAAVSHPR
jgi:hypothetical protein